MATLVKEKLKKTTAETTLNGFCVDIPQVVKIRKIKEKEIKKNDLYHRLDRAFADVRLMLDGKKKGKTLDELIEELDELQHRNNC